MDGWMYRRTLGWSMEGVVSHVHWSHTAEAAPPRHIPAVEGKYQGGFNLENMGIPRSKMIFQKCLHFPPGIAPDTSH